MNLEHIGWAGLGHSPRSDQKTGELRRDGWLLELERALLQRGAASATELHGKGNRTDACVAGGESAAAGYPERAGGSRFADRANSHPEMENRREISGGNSSNGRTVDCMGHLTGSRAGSPDMPAQMTQVRAVQQAACPIFLSPGAANGENNSTGSSEAKDLSAYMSEETAYPADAPGTSEPGSAGGGTAGEEYGRRRLHLYHGADGVQAWIRDVELTQPYVPAVAQALDKELRVAGLKLSRLTVNGKQLADTSAVHGERARAQGNESASMTQVQQEAFIKKGGN